MTTQHLPKLILYPWQLSIIKLTDASSMSALWKSKFLSVTRTPNEFSVVCETALVPEEVHEISDEWQCIAVEGPLDFALTGILAPMASILAQAQVSIFAVSSFDTDFILVKQEKLRDACEALQAHGYDIRGELPC